MQQRRFEVAQIHCQGCRQTIDSALRGVDGVDQVDPDIATNLVTVTYDGDRITDDEISDRLAEAGFPVQQVSGGARGNGSRGGAMSRYGVLIVAVLAIALAGYVGYVLYPRFDLPAAQGAGLLGLAAAAGIASFFSPCSFPLLLGLLGRQAVRQADDGNDTARPLVFGGALAAGAAAFMILAGIVVGLGGEALFAGVTFTSTAGIAIRTTVGLLLIVLGLIQVGRLPFSMHAVEDAARPLSRRSAKLRREHPVAGFGLFGFAYVLAGFG
jgi:copper chaperone CopZ/cytochrome c biogenesis protein CcdA